MSDRIRYSSSGIFRIFTIPRFACNPLQAALPGGSTRCAFSTFLWQQGFQGKTGIIFRAPSLQMQPGLALEVSIFVRMQLDQQIQHVHQKLQQLLKRFGALQKEKEQLQEQLTSLQSEKRQQSQSIELLQQKVQVLQAAKGEMNEEEKKAFDKRLSQYIREIDRCIAMLSE